MKLLFRALAATLLLAASIAAQDSAPAIVGRWTGTADTTDEGGTKRQEAQTLEIKLADGKLSGSTIGKTGKPGMAFQVQQDGAKFNLYGFIDFEGGEHLRWKLELKDGKLVGTFSALHDSPKKWVYDRIGATTLTPAPRP